MSLSKPLTEVEKIRHLKDKDSVHPTVGKDLKDKDSVHPTVGKARQFMTEVEKIRYLQQKYQDSKRLYTVYERSGEEGRFVFTLIYGTDQKSKAINYVQRKELEGLFLIVYCARPKERSSKCVYVSGLQNGLASPPTIPGVSPSSSGSNSSEPPPSPGTSLNGLAAVAPSRVKVAPGASRGSKDGTHTTPASKEV